MEVTYNLYTTNIEPMFPTDTICVYTVAYRIGTMLRWDDCVKRDVRKAGEEEYWKKKTRDR